MKKTTFYYSLIFTLLFNGAFAQMPAKLDIKGTVRDTTKESVPFATIMLLNAADSSLLHYTITNYQGEFAFNNIKNASMLLKISHVSYLPLIKSIKPSEVGLLQLPNIVLKPISQELMEVVIKAAKAPISIRGDTVEYDASTFQVPPGSTVEDLLRRLPGIDVDADGNISTQGKDVKRLYVDGKTFFGNDPKSITKNFDANAVSKVQVYNEQSEQSKLTGVDDGTKEKAMNIELKNEYKKGSFGKITIAGGTDERVAARGNFNRFNEKMQFSVLAFGNNINQTGVNWEDYGEFKGNNSFSGYDNGDFGFGGFGERGYYVIGGSGSIFNNYDGRGMTENFGAGTNFNYDHKKTKFNSSYFYNQTHLNYISQSERLTHIDSLNSYKNNDTTQYADFRTNHSVNARLEHEPDSMNRIIAKADFRFSTDANQNINDQHYTDYQLVPYNVLSLNNKSELKSYAFSSSLILRHKFKKKGRVVAASGGYNTNQSDGKDSMVSVNRYLNPLTPTQQIRQWVSTPKNSDEFKASALYTESFGKRVSSELFYNFRHIATRNNRQAYPFGSELPIDSLSRYFEQVVDYNRIGTEVRYNYNGLNASAGVALQQLTLGGRYALDKGMDWNDEQIDKSYLNITPSIDIDYEINDFVSLNVGYENEINAPEFSDLLPVLNIGNPSYQVLGNMNLKPENRHSMSMNMYYSNEASLNSFGLYGDYTITQNPIIYNQYTEFDSISGVKTISMPENMSQSRSFYMGLWSDFNVYQNKLSVSPGFNISNSQSPIQINQEEDQSSSVGYSASLSINIKPSKKLMLRLRVAPEIQISKYELNSEYDQTMQEWSASASIKWQVIEKTFFESSFSYSNYKSTLNNYEEKVPLWHASIRRLLGKTNKFEVRFSVFDIFNKNISYQQFSNLNYSQITKTNTLARYFMLSLSYNMKGYDAKLKQNNYF